MTRVRVAHVATVDLTVRFLLLPQLRRLVDEGYEVTAISAPGPWVEDIEAAGIDFVAWTNATRAWGLASDARAFRELVGLLRAGRFDLVHTHNPKPGVMGRIAARAVGVPCVVNTVHGFWATPEDRAIKKAAVLGAEAVSALTSDLELYQSAEDLRWGRRAFVVSRRRSRLLGNGTDLERFDRRRVPADRVRALRSELGLGDGVVVGCVGRLVAEKGYRELFEAAARVRAVHPDVRFLVLGEPDLAKPDALTPDELERASKDVVLAGWREDVRDLLACMDVFVLASWREGVPRSAIEAAAMGLPLVLTDIRGCREVATDGVEGFLVPPRRTERLVAAIEQLVRDAELRSSMGKAARARAESRFDERRVLETIVGGYWEVLARKGIRAPGSEAPVVRRAVPRDAAWLATLHRRAMPTAFLPSLGDRFLVQLYRGLIADPSSLAVVAEDASGVLGAACATGSTSRFFRRFATRRGIPAALSALPTLVDRTTFARARETARYPTSSADLPEAELLSIAVEPRGRRRGVGRALADAIGAEMGRRGISEMKVVVDAANAPANAFYASIGGMPARAIEVHAGVTSNVWVIPCRSSSRSRSA